MQIRRRRSKRNSQQQFTSTEYMSLANLPEGAKGTVVQTSGGLGLVRRLSDMGLTPGCEVKVLRKCSFHGPIEIEVRGVALALGYGLASRICVQPRATNHD